MNFDYQKAFSRNIGWVTPDEQQTLRGKRVAIAGCGGVGGKHLETLVRLGISKFHIADFDTFDIHNFNRQNGADMSSVGRAKTEVLQDLATRINPEVEVTVFENGVTPENLDDFLNDVDVYVDGLDFFVLPIRRQVFAACDAKNIPAVTAAPLGMGVALLNFVPGKMSFESYFCLDGQSEHEQYLRFLVALSPALLQRPYLVYPDAVDFAGKRGPSTPMATDLCAGVASTQVLKLLLRRGEVVAAPWGLHFDAYRNKMKKTWRPGGNRNPLQKIALLIARRVIGKM